MAFINISYHTSRILGVQGGLLWVSGKGTIRQLQER